MVMREAVGMDVGALRERLVMLRDANGPEAEAYRTLRTNLRFDPRLAERTGGRAYLLADAGGVTDRAAVVANLAVACALADERVILVDADLRGGGAGSVSALFGQAESAAGLTTAITGPEDDRKVVLPLVETAVPNLLLLPAGARSGATVDVLGAGGFGILLAALRAGADVVLFDAPPVTDAADSRAIAAQVDGVLLLVAQGKTRRPQAQRALEALEQVGATVLGVVLTETS
jgi:capsular exopolysaccharide synthesis family protein